MDIRTVTATQFYIYAMSDLPGVAAANNFMSVFNPAGTNRVLIFFQAEIKSYSMGAAAVDESLEAYRTTAASGGTLVAASAINRFLTTVPNPIAEVRHSNPTVTTSGIVLNSWPPPLSTGVGAASTAYTSVPPGAGFICRPGEGIVFTTASGDTDQRWSFNIIWAEKDLFYYE